MRTWKKAAAMGAVVAASGLGMLAGAGPASAATYGDQCGGGYSVVNHADLTGGTVFLTFNASTGNNCVVTVRNTSGTAVRMEAWLKRSDSSTWTSEIGNFTSWAGPIYVHAPGVCVDWGGRIAPSGEVFRFNTNCS